jgi:antitoxin component of MazEF toxin-antitoxin module
MQIIKVHKKWITSFDGGWVYLYNDNHDMERVRITKVIKSGTSLAVVIPKSVLEAVELERGDQVVFGIVDDKTIAIRKISGEELKAIRLPQT